MSTLTAPRTDHDRHGTGELNRGHLAKDLGKVVRGEVRFDEATTQQVKKLMTALKDGTPNRNRIALQMTKDMLDESSFEASPGSRIPDKVADAASKVVDSALGHTKES